jgi:hypothetical protein
VKVTRRMRDVAKLCGVDPRDTTAVLRWERERSARMAEALCRLAAEEGHAS